MKKPNIPLIKTNSNYTQYINTKNLISKSPNIKSNSKHSNNKSNLNFHLYNKKQLIKQKTKIINTSFILKIINIITNIIKTKLQYNKISNTTKSIILHIITSITNILLITSIIIYNLIKIKLQLITTKLKN